MSVLWDILKCWSKTHPVKSERFIDGTPLKAILTKPPENEYDLEEIHPDANPNSRRNALVRFPENPTAHWGPGTRATIMYVKANYNLKTNVTTNFLFFCRCRVGDNKMAKSIKNQDKNKNRGKKRCSKEEYLEKKKQLKNDS